MGSSKYSKTSGGGFAGTEGNNEESNEYDFGSQPEISNSVKLSQRINFFRNQRRKSKLVSKVVTTVKRSNKIVQALHLPKIANLNPRSVYNKLEEFCTFVIEEEIDIVFMSESHERWYPTQAGTSQTLNDIIHIDNHIVISNPSQRVGKGGRPALIVDNTKYLVQNLTQSEIVIPWGVEIVWAVLTPLNTTLDSNIQKIVVGSLYCKPNSRKKTALLDHIAEVFQIMSAKYQKGLHWIIAGDYNELKIQTILDITPRLKQVVKSPTRLNPPRILDKILTTLAPFYQEPQILPPLDNDPDKDGKPSDHNIVVMSAINVLNNKPGRTVREVIFRPITEGGIEKMKSWLNSDELFNHLEGKEVNQKADDMMQLLQSKVDIFFPREVEKCQVTTSRFLQTIWQKPREENKKNTTKIENQTSGKKWIWNTNCI